MAQPALQGQLAHAQLPHARRVRVAQAVRRDPGRADAGTRAGAGEQANERGVGQRLAAAPALAADQEQQRARGVGGPLGHDIGTDRLQRRRLVQVHHALGARLLPHAPGMVLAVADGHAPPAVGDIAQVQPERLAGPQAAIEHQAHQREVPPAPERAQQGRDLALVQRPRQAPDRFDQQRAPGLGRAGDAGQEGAVAVGGAHQGAVHHARDRVGILEPPGQDRPVVEGRHRRE